MKKRLEDILKNLLASLVFVVVAICLYRVHNRNTNIGQRQNAYLSDREFSKSLISPTPFNPTQFDPIKVDYSSFISKRTFDPIKTDPEFYRASSSIRYLFIWKTDLRDLFCKFMIFCKFMNRLDSKLRQYVSVNSNMECESNLCSEKSLPSGKKEKWSLFRFRRKKKYIRKRHMKIIEQSDFISLIIFEGDIQDRH